MASNQYSGFYVMANFIKTEKKDVPEELRNKCMINEHGITLAVYWLLYMKDLIEKQIASGRRDVCVPEWMRHDPEHKDKRDWTIAMHWITMFNCDVPKWMHHDPNIQNSKGKTVGMLYLMDPNNEEEYPNWMICDVNKFDEYGNSILDYWLEYTVLDIPEWMVGVDKNFRNGNGETTEMSWIIHRKSVPPKNLRLTSEDEDGTIRCDKNIKTKYGMTYKDIYNKVLPNVKCLYEHEGEDEDEDDLSQYILE